MSKRIIRLEGTRLSTYGFKLLRIELHEGQRRKLLDFGNPSGEEPAVPFIDLVAEDVAKSIERLEKERLERRARVESPTLKPGMVEFGNEDLVEDEPGEDADDRQVLVRFEKATRLRSALLVEAYFGRVDDHARALHKDGASEDIELKGRATARSYRALLITPDAGQRAFLAVETISNSSLGKNLNRRLYQARYRHDFKFRPKGAVADEASVAELLDSHASKIEIKRSVIGSDQKLTTDASTTLTFNLGRDTSRERSIRDLIQRWVPTKKNVAANVKLSKENEATSVVSLLWPELDEADDVHFTDPVVTIDGRFKKKLGPLSMRDGFVYDLGPRSLSDQRFVDEVRSIVDRVLLAEGVNMADNWSSFVPTVPSVGGSS